MQSRKVLYGLSILVTSLFLASCSSSNDTQKSEESSSSDVEKVSNKNESSVSEEDYQIEVTNLENGKLSQSDNGDVIVKGKAKPGYLIFYWTTAIPDDGSEMSKTEVDGDGNFSFTIRGSDMSDMDKDNSVEDNKKIQDVDMLLKRNTKNAENENLLAEKTYGIERNTNFQTPTPRSKESSEDEASSSSSEADYQSVDIATFSRYFKKYVNNDVKVQGTVAKVENDDSDGYILTVTDSNYDHDIAVGVSSDVMDGLGANIEEDDVITVSGTATDSYTSTSISGSESDVPGIDADSINIDSMN